MLCLDDVTQRAKHLEHFILIADVCIPYLLTQRCRMLNNFSSMWAVAGALNSAAIFRLRRTWDLIGYHTKELFEKMNFLTQISRNYAHYRELLRQVNLPCVPFSGLYNKDLIFIQDGNPDMIPNSVHLINFSKRQRLADIVIEIRMFQSVP